MGEGTVSRGRGMAKVPLGEEFGTQEWRLCDTNLGCLLSRFKHWQLNYDKTSPGKGRIYQSFSGPTLMSKNSNSPLLEPLSKVTFTLGRPLDSLGQFLFPIYRVCISRLISSSILLRWLLESCDGSEVIKNYGRRR